MTHQVMIGLFLVLITNVLISITASNEPTLEFFKGVRRLDTESYIDYYFGCNVKARFMVWKLADEILTSFQTSDAVGYSLVNKRSNYEYTATLLSSEPIGNDSRAMDSIIVVSFRSREASSFEVTCSSGLHSQTTVRTGPVTDVTSSSTLMHDDDNPDIVLDYITSREIVRKRQTHIFICGVNHTSQLLQANGPPLVFRSDEKLGINRIASASTYTVTEQGILVARDPLPTVSILIVAHDTDVEVACFYGTEQARLRSNITHVAQLRSTTEIVTESSTSATTTLLANTEVQPTTKANPVATPQDNIDVNVSENADGNSVAWSAVIGIVLSVFIIVICAFIAVVMYLWRYKRSKTKVIELSNVSPEFNMQNVQECDEGKGEKPELRGLRSRKKTKGHDRMHTSVRHFNANSNSYIKEFNPLQAQADEVLEVKPSEIHMIQRGGSQFARILTGKAMKIVYVQRDGETFLEDVNKLKVTKQEKSSSYWKIMGRLLRGLLIKSYAVMKLHSLIQRNRSDHEIAQVQEGGSQLVTVSSGKLSRPFYIEGDGETITHTPETFTRYTSQQAEVKMFCSGPSEETVCRWDNKGFVAHSRGHS